jgi:hypothetical protein
MKKITLITLIILIILISPSPLQASDSTSSAVSQEDVKEKIKERLEKTVEKGLEKVKGVLTQERENQLYAWVGPIEKIDLPQLSIKTIDDLKEAKIASSAAIFQVVSGKGKKEIKAEEIKINQFALVMGPKDENEVILGKRIIVLDETPIKSIKREVISGKVNEIDETEVTLQKDGEEEVLIIGKKAKLKINGIKSPTVEDIQVGDYLSAIVTLDKNDEVDEVRAVLVIPGKTNPQAEENEVTQEEIESSTESASEETAE